MIAWMGVAMMVSTRLWIAEVVSQTRDLRKAHQDWVLMGKKSLPFIIKI
jgi:hypothetical protein